MGVYAKDGTAHHSMSRARMHEGRMSEQTAKPKGDMPKQDGGKAEETSSNEPIEDVVASHGPAKEMHYHHDEATGKHHVHSKHGEHEHKSEHETAEEAGEHMHKAMGADSEDEPDDEELGEEAGEEMPAMEEGSSHRIPGLG